MKKIMYRFNLATIFILLFSFFNTQAQNEIVLEKVSVEDASIMLFWQYRDADSVTIYKCNKNCDNQAIAEYPVFAKVIMDSTNLKWTDQSASVTLRNDYRIGWGAFSWTAPQSNMVLNAGMPQDSCPNSVLLSWNPYINMTDTVDWYKIFYRKKNVGNFLIYDSLKGKHLTFFNPANKINYIAKYLANEVLYEFVIQAVSNNDTIYSYSNIAEYKTGFEFNDPATVRITCVSVINDEYIEINVSTDQPFEKLYLMRDKPHKRFLEKDSLTFTIIDSISENSPTNQYHFIDKNVSPKTNLYYYMVVASYKCKQSDTSNILTNIYLTGSRAEKYGDNVSFAQVRIPHIEPLEWFELLRIIFEEEALITNTLTIINCGFFIDVKPFITEGAVMKYVVKSESGCYSNTLTIEHEPFIEFPNAFYPDGNDMVNKTFYPILKFPSEDDYLFVIYNRWGQELYRSTLPPVYNEYQNMQGRWDGKFQGKDCPSGFYAYQIKYSYNQGEGKYSNSGSFMLVR
jgi:gliding motility-associated-like protein